MISRGTVHVRNNRTGQVVLKFRDRATKDRVFPPVPIQDLNNRDSYINLSQIYSSAQMIASTLEDLVLAEDLELRN
jgi:hypothetical protein